MDTHAIANQIAFFFTSRHPTIDIDANSFSIRPRETLEEGLSYFLADGLISEEDFNRLLEEFDFRELTLQEYLAQNHGREQVKELIICLSNIK